MKIRFGDFKTITRSQALSEPSDSTRGLWCVAAELLDAWAKSAFAPVRLIGVQATPLTGAADQLSLFRDDVSERQGQLDRAVDAINRKLGGNAVSRGGRRR